MKKTDMVIYIPNYKSSYAIENRVDSLEEWKESCVEAGVDCPVDVAMANGSALITFDKARPTGEFDKDVDFMRGFLADIEDARRLDMQECACESITVIRDTSPKDAGVALIEKLKQQGDFEPFDLIQISNLITGATNEDAIYASSGDGKQIAMESGDNTNTGVVKSHTPEIPDVQPVEVTPQVEPEVATDEHNDDNQVAVTPVEPEPVINELADDEKEFTPEERKSIRAMLAFWKMNTRRNAEQLSKAVEPEDVPEVEPVGDGPVIDGPESEQHEPPVTPGVEEEPNNDSKTSEQQDQNTVNEVAENTGIGEEGYCHQDALPNIQNPHAGIGNESAGLSGTVYGALNNDGDTTSNEDTEPVPEDEEETVDAESAFNTGTAKPTNPQELVIKLAMESASDDELFEKLLANKDVIPEDIMTESTEISLFEKIKNNTILNISPMTKMQRNMRISLG